MHSCLLRCCIHWGDSLPTFNEPMIFDGHNDVLLKLLINGGVDAAPGFISGRDGHIDIPRASAGGFGGGFFALYVRSPSDGKPLDDKYDEMKKPQYDLPLPAPVTQETALPVIMEEIAILLRLQELGALKICLTADDLRDCFASGKMAAIMPRNMDKLSVKRINLFILLS